MRRLQNEEGKGRKVAGTPGRSVCSVAAGPKPEMGEWAVPVFAGSDSSVFPSVRTIHSKHTQTEGRHKENTSASKTARERMWYSLIELSAHSEWTA
jgi:hypothetical protein